MKKVFWTMLLFTLWPSTSFASEIKIVGVDKQVVKIQTVCLNGFTFAVSSTGQTSSIVQVFRKYNNYNNPPVPLECK